MRQGRRAIALGAAVLTMATMAGCTSAADEDATAASAAQSSAHASTSAAAPGTYGAPVDPSTPDPTDVATDAPFTSAPSNGVPVVVTYSGWTDTSAAIEFGAYVPDVVEAGGTCTLTLTAGSATVTAQVAAGPDASSTSCLMMAIPGTELASGRWQAVVSYESPSASGRSNPVTVTVP